MGRRYPHTLPNSYLLPNVYLILLKPFSDRPSKHPVYDLAAHYSVASIIAAL